MSAAASQPVDAPANDEFYTDLPVGEILRRARMQKGLTIEQAETHLHIRAVHLEALERSDFDALPGRVYVIGFIRTYAEFLNLDGNRVVHLLKRQSSGLGTPQSLNVQLLPSDNRLPTASVAIATMTALFLLILGWVAYQNMRIGPVEGVGAHPVPVQSLEALEKLVATPAAQPITAPVDTPAAPAPAPKAAEPGIVIMMTGDSWLEVRSPDGRVLDARMFRTGESFKIKDPVDEFGNAYVITMGNAAGVSITLDGRTLPSLGGLNQVRRNVSLNPKALKILLGDPE